MKIKGTKGSDFITIDAVDLVNAKIKLKSGLDTLAITSTGDYSFDTDSYRDIEGVEILDFTGISGDILNINIDKSLLKDSDDDELTIISGENGITSLQAEVDDKGTLFVGGTGVVQLADGFENEITIADNSSVQVIGGTGRDTITAANDGSVLNGGGGNDKLKLGDGADVVVFGAGSGADKVKDFDITQDQVNFSDAGFATVSEILAAAVDDGGDTVINLTNGDKITLKDVKLGDLGAQNFTIAGVALAIDTYVIEVGTTAAELNSLIATVNDGSTFILTNGTHTFSESIIIDRGNINFKGESEAGTIIQFDFPEGQVSDGLQVTGGARTYLGTASSGVNVGDTSIEIAGNSLAAGDTIYMFQQNTREWLDANGWQNVSMEDADRRPFREVILQVDRVEGDIVHFTHEIPYAMDQGKVKLNYIEMFEGLNISDFTVTHNLGTANSYDFTNTLPAYLSNTAFSMVGTVGATLERVSVVDIGSKGLVIGSTIDLQADDLYTSGAHNKGGGGNGYGLLLYESNNNSLTNLEIYDTRHGFITSAWSAETDNYIQIADTNRDVGFHGSPDRGNVVEIDNSVLDFDVPFYGNGGSGWTVISGSGSTHAAIDPYAENKITFGNVEGVNRNDIAHANDSGVYMNGKYGYDTLIGGAGDDYIVGGTLSDKLTGNGGSDTFLFRVGDGLDTITDMEFGANGDLIVFADNESVTAFEDLYFYTRNDELRVRFGANATVILEGVELADVVADNFAFDPTGTLTAELYFGSDYIAV